MKQVIVVNEALRLPRGKLAAQVAHAALGAFLTADPATRTQWLTEGMPKIVVGCPSLEDLLALEVRAKEAGIATFLVRDAGRTVVTEGTVTCLGLGPAEAQTLDTLTGALRLV